MRVLVTGSHGYIGSVLTPIFGLAGHDVLGLDTRYYRGCDFGPELGEFDSVGRDVRDVTPSELEGFDAIVHLAALSNDPLGDFDRRLTEQINFAASVRLATAAREAGVRRFVFASSCSMYGASGSDDTLDEKAPLRPLTAYAESKVRAEEELMGLAGPDFVPVSMRNATVYGASPRLRLDIVLNNLAAWSLTTGRIRLLSDGTAWRPLIHVRDVAKAALALLEVPEEVVRGTAINIGSNEQNYLIRDLAGMLSETTGCEVDIAEGSVADQRSYRVDFSLLGRLLPDLTLDWNAELGARELVDSMSQVGLTAAEFDSDRYVRLRRLKTLLERGDIDGELRWQTPAESGA